MRYYCRFNLVCRTVSYLTTALTTAIQQNHSFVKDRDVIQTDRQTDSSIDR